MQWVHNVSWYPVILSFIATSLAFVIDPALTNNKIYVLSVVLIGFWGMTLLNYLGIKTNESLQCDWRKSSGTIAPGLLIICLGLLWLVKWKSTAIPQLIRNSVILPNVTEVGNIVFLTGLFLAFAGLEGFSPVCQAK